MNFKLQRILIKGQVTSKLINSTCIFRKHVQKARNLIQMSNFFEDEEEPPFLIAYPPQDDSPGKRDSRLDLSNQIAFQTIDELCYDCVITVTETAIYKARYIKLHEALKKYVNFTEKQLF